MGSCQSTNATLDPPKTPPRSPSSRAYNPRGSEDEKSPKLGYNPRGSDDEKQIMQAQYEFQRRNGKSIITEEQSGSGSDDATSTSPPANSPSTRPGAFTPGATRRGTVDKILDRALFAFDELEMLEGKHEPDSESQPSQTQSQTQPHTVFSVTGVLVPNTDIPDAGSE